MVIFFTGDGLGGYTAPVAILFFVLDEFIPLVLRDVALFPQGRRITQYTAPVVALFFVLDGLASLVPRGNSLWHTHVPFSNFEMDALVVPEG